ncbi:unnamed protein product [Adineta steineri]|uniref:Uncharacterized protein n=3 Tax=Adineta steineri TaxID=433720 RepID=A0A818M997_9BILA|nr:unnamed protein product [Adineta steineri]CAF0946664.1 unnamed protein product [Adineta steineri]CAF1055565.1 unnamed protein product [Adineta steineri]CAF3589489.1 unnamed protein product [Adineta steineri]CAF3687471.1 unnamed protein product [Adineta steineri]
MNIFTQIATQFLINKTTLIELLKTLNFSNEFLDEFRHDRISIDEESIRRKIRFICEINKDESFQDLFCHEDGIQLVFHINFHEYRCIRFRISFDIKIIALILNNHHQTIQFMINNIQIKSLNRLSKAFRFYLQSRARNLVTDEIERIFKELNIPYDRLFSDIKRPLTYEINLSNIKEFDQFRERYLIIGNRSILDLIQITYVEHREQAIVLGYRLHTALHEETTIHFIDC